MVKSFPEKNLRGTKVKRPLNDHLFKVIDKSPQLPKSKAEKFYTVTAQGLFLYKRGIPDINRAIVISQQKWEILIKMIGIN